MDRKDAPSGAGIAHEVDASKENTFWQANYTSRPYYQPGETYELYEPAYRYGWESFSGHQGQTFDEVEPELSRGWENAKRGSKLTWDRAKAAVRDAWHRVERAIPGDFEKDGR